MALRCLIVDDNDDFLEAARQLLEREGVDVVGVASTSTDAVQRAAELQPEVTLVDIYLGDESGFDLAHELAQTGDPGAIILISTYSETDVADIIAVSPVVGFVSKPDLSKAAIQAFLGVSDQKR